MTVSFYGMLIVSGDLFLEDVMVVVDDCGGSAHWGKRHFLRRCRSVEASTYPVREQPLHPMILPFLYKILEKRFLSFP